MAGSSSSLSRARCARRCRRRAGRRRWSGAVRRARVVDGGRRVVSMPPASLAEGVDPADAGDVGVRLDGHVARDADVEVADVAGHVDRSRPSRACGSRTSVRSSHDLADVHRVAALRPAARVAGTHDRAVGVPPVGDRGADGDGGGDQADQDDPAGPAEERADQQERRAQRRAPCGVRRGGDVGAGQVGDAERRRGRRPSRPARTRTGSGPSCAG